MESISIQEITFNESNYFLTDCGSGSGRGGLTLAISVFTLK